MDDSYGSSYGTSLDSEPCVSPSTKERYTFNRSSSNHTSRLSDHFQRSRQDSVAEEEVIDVDEDARESFEDDGLMFRPDNVNPSSSTHHAEKSKLTKCPLIGLNCPQEEVIIEQRIKSMVVSDTGETVTKSDLNPTQYSGEISHDRKSSLLDAFPTKFLIKKEETLYKPLLEQLKEYHTSQDYWFDFSTAPDPVPALGQS